MPETLLGLVVFAASVGPGWVFLRVAERWTPRRDRSPLQEAAELVVVGATASAIAVLLVLGIAESIGAIDSHKLIADRLTFPAKEPFTSLLFLLAVLLISYGGSFLLASLIYTPFRVPSAQRRRIRPNDTVWYGGFARDLPHDHAVWVDVAMDDGRQFSGLLRAFPTDEAESRELLLAPPDDGQIELRDAGGSVSKLNSDRLVLKGEEIREVYVRYVPLREESSDWRVAPRAAKGG